MNNSIKLLLCGAPLLLVLATGCTHMINPPKQAFTGYTTRDKVKLNVAVNITDELQRAKWEKRSMGDTWVIPIGKGIANNAGPLARQTFEQVVVVTNGQPAVATDAVLTPKVAYINRTTGATSFGKSIVAIKLEWNLVSADGKSIWLETINGESSGSTGWTNPEKILEKALEDLLRKSHEAMASSQAIRQFASSKSARVSK